MAARVGAQFRTVSRTLLRSEVWGNDRTVAGRTGAAVVPDEEMLDQCVDRAAAVAAHLVIFENGHIAGATNLARFEDSCCSIFPESVQFRARNFHNAWIL